MTTYIGDGYNTHIVRTYANGVKGLVLDKPIAAGIITIVVQLLSIGISIAVLSLY
jgi:hypothetical protein